jgi:hypothetical protein
VRELAGERGASVGVRESSKRVTLQGLMGEGVIVTGQLCPFCPLGTGVEPGGARLIRLRRRRG